MAMDLIFFSKQGKTLSKKRVLVKRNYTRKNSFEIRKHFSDEESEMENHMIYAFDIFLTDCQSWPSEVRNLMS